MASPGHSLKLNFGQMFFCSALQEAQDIFGVDFDFDEFDQYDGDVYDEDEDDEDVRPIDV